MQRAGRFWGLFFLSALAVCGRVSAQGTGFIFQDTFDAGNALGWTTASQDPSVSAWGIGTGGGIQAPLTSPNTLNCVISTASGAARANAATAASPLIAIGGAARPSLWFACAYTIGGGSPNTAEVRLLNLLDEAGHLLFRRQYGHPTPIPQPGIASNLEYCPGPSVWHGHLVELISFSGSGKVRLEFVSSTDGSVQNPNAGWFVDNVQVQDGDVTVAAGHAPDHCVPPAVLPGYDSCGVYVGVPDSSGGGQHPSAPSRKGHDHSGCGLLGMEAALLWAVIATRRRRDANL